MTFTEFTDRIQKWPTPWVELTGGKPLLQPATPALADLLLERGYRVLIETAVPQD